MQNKPVQAVNQNERFNNYPMENSVAQKLQYGKTTSCQDTEKLNIAFRTKLQLEQARFQRRNFELEVQMRKLETKHQLLQEEREHERKAYETALEDDNFCFQSTIPRDKSSFNWNVKKRDVSVSSGKIDKLLSTNRSTAHIETTAEVKRRSHFSRFRNSRDHSSGVEH